MKIVTFTGCISIFTQLDIFIFFYFLKLMNVSISMDESRDAVIIVILSDSDFLKLSPAFSNMSPACIISSGEECWSNNRQAVSLIPTPL